MAEEKIIRKTCSRIGFALCALVVVRDGVGILLSLLHLQLLKGGSAGIGSVLVSVMESSWFSVAGRSILGYLITIPMFLWLLRKLPGGVPDDIMVKKKLRVKKLLSLFVIAMGLGYVFNLVGVIINLIIAIAKGVNFSTLNPIMDVMQQITPIGGIYVALAAPVIEEFLFRGVILGKTKQYGEKTAILFSAVLFGLLHGNIAQTLYATFIGLILGYTAVKTGGIVYSCIIHMMINSYSILITFGAKYITGYSFSVFLSLLIISMALLFLVLAIIFLSINWRRTSYERGEILEAVGDKKMMRLVCLNPGVILFTLLCVGMIFYYVII